MTDSRKKLFSEHLVTRDNFSEEEKEKRCQEQNKLEQNRAKVDKIFNSLFFYI